MKEQMHEYLSRNLIDNSFEFNREKTWYDICTDLIYQYN